MRRSHTTRRVTGTLVLVAVAARGVVVLPPSTWRDALGQKNSGAPLSGSARVMDGDTLQVRGPLIRMHGIDAPERGQRCRAEARGWPCGRETACALSRRIGGRSVACQERDRDHYDRRYSWRSEPTS